METNNLNNREKYIDVAAGGMIITMLLCHCWYFSKFPMRLFLQFLGFYMPWFFYKSGMYFRPQERSELTKKDASKLLFPYIVFSIFGWMLWCICGLVDGSLILKDFLIQPVRGFLHRGSISGNEALWFLLSFFIVRYLANILLNKKCPPQFLSLFCFIFAFSLYVFKWYKYCWWFGNIFSGMFFFLMGYWLKDQESKLLFVLSALFYGIVVIAYGLGLINNFPFLYMHANKMYEGSYGSYLLFYPMALAGIIVTNYILRILCKYIRFRLLEYVGINAMNIYVTHWILMALIVFIAKQFFNIESPIILLSLLVGGCVIFLPIINIYCPINKITMGLIHRLHIM